jgi:hypothetical protein
MQGWCRLSALLAGELDSIHSRLHMRSPASDCGRNPHARTRAVKDAHQSSLHGSSCLTEQQELTPKDRAPQDVLRDTQRPRLPNIVVLHVTASQAFVSSPGSVLAPSLVALVSNQHVICPNPASSSAPNFKHAALITTGHASCTVRPLPAAEQYSRSKTPHRTMSG